MEGETDVKNITGGSSRLKRNFFHGILVVK
jgi:hypothetical protein